MPYPLTFPSTKAPARIALRARSAVGMSMSPFTFAPGDMWEADVVTPKMLRADAEVWVAFLLALNGREGTFLMGEPVNTTPQGTWAGQSPLVFEAHDAGVKTVTVDGLTAASTGIAGDWLQFGTGADSHLHKLTQDFTANGSGEATIEFWPALREALADNAGITLANPKGVFRLASNVREWSIDIGRSYGFQFSCVEDV
jgi:hypothetical protein